MDVIRHFSCHTRLPIRLATVREHVMEMAKINHMVFYGVDIDATQLAGMLRMYRRPDKSLVAEIFYAQTLEPTGRRIVCTKEMIHASDGDSELANTIARVDRLLEDIVIPSSLARSLPGASDGNGLLYALAVLLPRDALHELRPLVKAGKLSAEDIAKYAMIPESYARFALTDQWESVVEKII